MVLTNIKIWNTYYFFLFFLVLPITNAVSQNWNSGWVYIENVKTGLVLDVKNDVKANGTLIWPYAINYGRAQMFRFNTNGIPDIFGDEAKYIMAYNNASFSSDFYVSVKQPPLKVQDNINQKPAGSNLNKPNLAQSPTSEIVLGEQPISTKKTLKNYILTIEAKQEIESGNLNSINDLASVSDTKPKQIWKLIPVSGEENTYYIQNVNFNKKMVLEPLDFNAKSTIVLSSFTGKDIQKWKILRTKPNSAINLVLSNFEWYEELNQTPWYKPWKWHHVQYIKGKLSWTNSNTSTLAKQYIRVEDDLSSNYETIELDANKTSHAFKIRSTTSSKTRNHCFKLNTQSKWIAENIAISNSLCEKPTFEEETIPNPTPPKGYNKLLVTNCHNDKKSVRLWTYDHTTNDGVWKDHGTLDSQWQGSGCPSGSPKEIDLSDGHTYSFIAIDCGNSPPNLSQSSCTKMITTPIEGDSDGIVYSISIDNQQAN